MKKTIDSVFTTFQGYFRYRGREGQLSFLLHRFTGLGTLLFLIVHIVDTAMVYFYPPLYKEALVLYQNPIFMIGEIGLVFCVIYHGVNGLRIAYVDLFKPHKWQISQQRLAVRWTIGISFLLWLPPAAIMFRNLVISL